MIIIMLKSSEPFPTTVDEYLTTVPEDVQKVLQKLARALSNLLFSKLKKELPAEFLY
jgi:hypothetical protein